jgi:hypothetical protein
VRDIRTSARLKALTNPNSGVKRFAHKGCGCGPSGLYIPVRSRGEP